MTTSMDWWTQTKDDLDRPFGHWLSVEELLIPLNRLARIRASCRRMSAATSERILQCQLKLAHRDGRGADHPEALTRGIGRRSRKYRTGENVPIGRTPRRVVQRVEGFHPELYDVVFVIRHLELLMHREIDRLEVRCG